MHVVIINGSPRVQKYSNTDKIISSFVNGYAQGGNTYELYSLSDRSCWNLAAKAFAEQDNIVIALPLYVECVPGLLLEWLESLTPKEAPGTQLSFILQGGFAEGIQYRCGEAFLSSLPAQLNCEFGGCLIRGDNFSIRITEGKERERITGPYERMGTLFAQKGNFFDEEVRKFLGPEQFSLPVRLLFSAIFKTFAKKRFDSKAREWGCTKPLTDRPLER